MRFKPFSQLTLGDILRAIGITVLVLVILLYIQFQARNFIQGPSIVLTEEPTGVQTTQQLLLRGQTENIVLLTLNGRKINTDELGNFEETVHLEKGLSITTLYAEDRFGRSTTRTLEYVYLPAE